MDGGGNQALRITAIKAISSYLDIGYSHTPISRIDYNGISSLEGDHVEPARLAAWNGLVPFQSANRINSSAKIIRVRTLQFYHLLRLRRLSAALRKPLIVSITEPFPVSDFFPKAYALVSSNTNKVRSRGGSRSPICVALHVRRGDLMWTHSERLLPIKYYLDVVLRIITILDSLNVPYVCELYSEQLTSSLTLQPGDHGISLDSEGAVVLDPGSSDLHGLDVIPNLEKFINHDPTDSVRRMASADVLVTSRSAFSYLAAINNRDGIVMYYPFWHPSLPGWIRCDQETLFSESLFRCRLRRLRLSINSN
jgi:hypothetical protein